MKEVPLNTESVSQWCDLKRSTIQPAYGDLGEFRGSSRRNGAMEIVDMHETQILGRYLLCLWDWSAPQITNPDSDLSGQDTFEAPGSAPIGTSLVHGAT